VQGVAEALVDDRARAGPRCRSNLRRRPGASAGRSSATKELTFEFVVGQFADAADEGLHHHGLGLRGPCGEGRNCRWGSVRQPSRARPSAFAALLEQRFLAVRLRVVVAREENHGNAEVFIAEERLLGLFQVLAEKRGRGSCKSIPAPSPVTASASIAPRCTEGFERGDGSVDHVMAALRRTRGQ